MNWAFGVIDADAARQYDKKINELQKSTIRLHHDQEQQLSIIKESIELNQKSYSNLNNLIKNITQQVAEVDNLMDGFFETLKFTQKFNEIINIIILMIIEHNRLSHWVFQQILRTLEETVQGKFHN